MEGISSTQGSYPDVLTSALPSSRANQTSSVAASIDSTTAGNPPADSITISSQGARTAKYVADARVLPPLNEQTIQKLKTAIAHGSYPPPALIEGLINLVGSGVTQSAPSGE